MSFVSISSFSMRKKWQLIKLLRKALLSRQLENEERDFQPLAVNIYM